MTLELREFVQEEHANVRQRHLARPRHVTPAVPPRVRDGMVEGAAWAGGDQGCASAGAAATR
jgi:hypothetical protein